MIMHNSFFEGGLKFTTVTVFGMSFILGFCTAFGLSRVVCDAHLRLLAPWTAWLFSQWILHRWRVNAGTTTRELFPCKHPSTPSTRLEKPQRSVFQVFGMTRQKWDPELLFIFGSRNARGLYKCDSFITNNAEFCCIDGCRSLNESDSQIWKNFGAGSKILEHDRSLKMWLRPSLQVTYLGPNVSTVAIIKVFLLDFCTSTAPII